MDLNCELCANKKECFDNSWCVTMDRGRKINGQPICDNFELSGRKYEALKEKNKKLEEEWDEAVEAMNTHYKRAEEYIKVINIMAKDISNTDMFPWDNIDSGKVKEYYFKKARGEEDVKD